MIWDDNQNRCIGELSFRSEVRAVRLRRDRIVVVLEYKIYVYNFADLKVLHQIETWRNVKGICGLSQAPNHLVLACPGTNRTQVGGTPKSLASIIKEVGMPCLRVLPAQPCTDCMSHPSYKRVPRRCIIHRSLLAMGVLPNR